MAATPLYLYSSLSIHTTRGKLKCQEEIINILRRGTKQLCPWQTTILTTPAKTQCRSAEPAPYR